MYNTILLSSQIISFVIIYKNKYKLENKYYQIYRNLIEFCINCIIFIVDSFITIK